MVPDHSRTPPRPHQGLQFEISDVMKKSKATKLLTSYHDPRQPGSLGGVTKFARALNLPAQKVRATDVKQNIFRFVIFIMWLKHQPQACEWFLTIREHHPDLIKACSLKLATL